MPIFRATSKYFPRSRQLPHFWCFSPFVAASYEGGGVSGLWKWWLSISERIRRSWIKRFQDLLRVQDRGTLWASYKDYLISSPVLLSLELVPVWCKLSAASWSGFYVRRPGVFFCREANEQSGFLASPLGFRNGTAGKQFVFMVFGLGEEKTKMEKNLH